MTRYGIYCFCSQFTVNDDDTQDSGRLRGMLQVMNSDYYLVLVEFVGLTVLNPNPKYSPNVKSKRMELISKNF